MERVFGYFYFRDKKLKACRDLSLTHGHTASKWQSRTVNLNLSSSRMYALNLDTVSSIPQANILTFSSQVKASSTEEEEYKLSLSTKPTLSTPKHWYEH